MRTNLLRIMNFSTFIKIVLTFWSVELREILYYKYLVVTNIQSVYILETIVLKPGPARRVNPGLEPGRVEEKIEEEKTRWPGWPSKTRSKAGCNSLAFVFFFLLKRHRFDLKKWIDPMTRSKPETRALDRAGHRTGSENYAWNKSFFVRVWPTLPGLIPFFIIINLNVRVSLHELWN